MSALDQIVYRTSGSARGNIRLAATSLAEHGAADRWLDVLRPWLQAGTPAGRGYLHLGRQAALLRWKDDAARGYAPQFAHVLIGPAIAMSANRALEFPGLPADLRLPRSAHLSRVPVAAPGPGTAPSAIETRARSAAAIELLVPLLSRTLAGEQHVTMPWTAALLPEAVLWGMVSILAMIGDSRPISFLTHAVSQAEAPAGLFILFRQGVATPPTDPGFGQAAVGLATSFADNPAQLRRALLQHGIPGQGDQAARVARLLDLWPSRAPAGHGPSGDGHLRGGQAINAYPGSTHTVNAYLDGQTPGPLTPRPGTAGKVICPICLHEIDNWTGMPNWHWDSAQNSYVELRIPEDASSQYRSRLQRGALIRCPDPHQVMKNEHYLPADYGNFGPPVVLGFIGVTSSGKSHLLTAMVGEMERDGLRGYGINSRPVDHALHKRFLDGAVRPLMTEGRVLPGTQEGVVAFADAFLISPAGGHSRPVALFDVAGGELTRVEDAKQFLEIADGLFFVVDPAQLNPDGLGDDTFNTVLDLVKSTGRLPDQVSAAIVLNKADMVRFEDPVALWLRSDSEVLDAAEFVEESADIYAFLGNRGAAAWTRPYHECAKATLHAASPTGGAGQRDGETDVFPRGVTPRRVLRPLVAMLAMTGVLTGAEAERVGI
jgi:hypothetical protein